MHGVMVVQTALGYRLPTILSVDEQEMGAMLDAGALLNLVVNGEDRHRRVTAMMDKILRGAKPGDIPTEQPTKFELVINLKTAWALGITVPKPERGRGDSVMDRWRAVRSRPVS